MALRGRARAFMAKAETRPFLNTDNSGGPLNQNDGKDFREPI
jgi:hypothetical protein